MSHRAFRFLAILVCVSLGTVATASAAPIQGGDVIKLDFSAAGNGDGGSLADWNVVTSGATLTPGTVKRHGDAAVVTGVGVSFSNFVAGNLNNDGNSANWPGTNADPYYILAADDIYFHGSGNDLSVTFNGLDPSLSYNVRIYSLINNQTTLDGFTVTDGLGTQFVQNTRNTRWNSLTLAGAGTVFSDLQLTPSNQLVVTINDIGSPFYPLNAIVLEAIAAVPEPAPIMIWSILGGLAMICGKRCFGRRT